MPHPRLRDFGVLKMRELMGRRGQDGWYEVACWCARSIVLVPTAEFRGLGLTRVCGRKHCQAPD